MIKKFLAYSILIAFGVLLTPRTFWHECDDHHSESSFNQDSEHTYSDSHLAQFEKKCFACDYDMNAAEEPVSFSTNFFAAFYPEPIDVKVVVRTVDCVRTQLLRGPPTI